MNTAVTAAVQAIENVAKSLGVPANEAIADAFVESSLSPTAQGDYNASGQPTSFGLFQLHKGGELGSLTPAEAENPTTNAQTALSVFAETQKANPGAGAGAVAFLSERPAGYTPGESVSTASSTTYAAEVQAIDNELTSLFGANPTPAQVASALPQLQAIKGDVAQSNTPAGAGGAVAGTGPLTGTNGLLSGAASWLTSGVEEWVARVGFVALGLVFLIVGLVVLSRSSSTARDVEDKGAVAAAAG